MAEATLELLIKLRDQASEGIADLAGGVEGVGKSAEETSSKFSGIGAAISTIAPLALGFAQESAQADKEAKFSKEQLKRSIENTGGSWSKYGEALLDAAGAGEALGFDDRETEAALAGIVDQTRDAAGAQGVLSAAMDLSRRTGKDLVTSSKLVANAMEGSTGPLEKLGVEFDKNMTAQQRLTAIQNQFAGASADFAATQITLGDHIATAYGNIQESVGAALGSFGPILTQLPAISGQFTAVTSTISGVFAALGVAAAPVVVVLGTLALAGAGLAAAWQSNFMGIREVVGPTLDRLMTAFGGIKPIFDNIIILAGNVQTAFGQGGLGAAFSTLTGGLSAIGGQLGDWLSNIGGLLSTLGSKLTEWVTPVIPVLTGKLQELASAAWGWVSEQAPILAGKLWAWGEAFVGFVSPFIPPLLAKLGELATAAWGWVSEQAPILLGQLITWGNAFVNFISPYIPPLLAKLGELAASVWGWITETALPTIVSQLTTWGGAFVDWIGPQIGPLLGKAGELLTSLGEWVTGTAFPAITAKLGEWGTAFVAWVGPQIGPLVGKLGELLVAINVWAYGTALPAIVGKLAEWGGAFVGFIARDVIPFIVPKLGALLVTIGDWILQTALPGIITKLTEWGSAFLGFVGRDVLPFIGGKLAGILTSISTWVRESVGAVAASVSSIGSNIVAGIWSGVTAKWGEFKTYLAGLLKELPGPLKKAIGIDSPSKVMAEQIGQWIPKGIAMGIDQHKGVITRAMLRLMSDGLNFVRPRPGALASPLRDAVADLGRSIPRIIGDGVVGELSELERAMQMISETVRRNLETIRDDYFSTIGEIFTRPIPGAAPYDRFLPSPQPNPPRGPKDPLPPYYPPTPPRGPKDPLPSYNANITFNLPNVRDAAGVMREIRQNAPEIARLIVAQQKLRGGV